jgi:hypothetical protein
MEFALRGEPRSANFADLTEKFATQISKIFTRNSCNSLMNHNFPERDPLLQTFLIRNIPKILCSEALIL